MGGGLLQLVAYGAQDAYITGNPHITFWKVLYKRHTNFAMEAFRVNFTGAPQYGQRVVAVINRNADLMYKTYLEVVLPDTTLVSGGITTGDIKWTGDAQRRLGYALLKKIEVEIGGQIIDTHYGEWLYLWENLTASYDTSCKLDAMVGGNIGGTTTDLTSCGGRPGILYIPLQFWFCRNPGLALPLIALQYHEVRLNITLGNATDLVSKGTYTSVAAAAAALPQLKDMSLYIDYIYLDVDERRRFAQQSHEYLIDQLQFGLQQTLTNSSGRIDLTLNHPVKELVWVFQDARRTDCAYANATLSDFTGPGYTQPFVYDDIINRCRLQINGQDRFDERYGDYFWKVQPYQHHSGGGFWPTRNALGGTVTGTITTGTQVAVFNGTNTSGSASITSVTVTSGSLVNGMGVSGVGIPVGTTLTFSGTTVTLSANSTANATGTLIGVYDPNTSNTESLTSGTVSGIQTYQAANPINVYSFALQPEEHQPSGTCNFSRIDTTTLVYESFKAANQISTNYPTKARPFNFRMYAVNYNIFRVMSGMGGLAYSN